MDQRRHRCGLVSSSSLLLGAALLLFVLAESALAASTGSDREPWLQEVRKKIRSPWFWFGMTAQFVFFMRFVVQWIASERKRRSTVPVAFWYLSLVGSLALFVYAIQNRDPVIMMGQLLACGIYVRNLMLISDWRKRRRQAGLPIDDLDADDQKQTAVPLSQPGR
jgi:lipid-A-disaccharide synthase-like uncharacterized protein